jgi:glycosyltransferase involved in cell wall biosynthesis
MQLIVYGGDDLRRIEDRMGSDEYSYHFVIEAFLPVLARIATTHRVRHLDEVEPIRAACERTGDACVILSFVPPHKTTLFMRVPLIPIFAWEFENIPCEMWDGQPKHDWRSVLQQQGKAITLSSHSAAVVRETMGVSFPAVGIAPPVHDRLAALRSRIGGRRPQARQLEIAATLIDSRAITLSPEEPPPPFVAPAPAAVTTIQDAPAAAPAPPAVPAPPARPSLLRRALGAAGLGGGARQEPLAAPAPLIEAPVVAAPEVAPPPRTVPPRVGLSLEGVVYLAILDPMQGRKNWTDILTAFTWGLRDAQDAVLVIKTVASRAEDYWEACWNNLRKQPAFACRVVLIDGFLDDEEMGTLLESAHYVVNCANGEGCALPLLEGMSVGRPAIAPRHTAMLDYIDESNAFVVASQAEVTAFPHDSRAARRTLWHLPQWDSLRDAFRASYRVARDDPERWLAMSRSAMAAQEAFCGDEAVETRLRDFLGLSSDHVAYRMGLRDLSDIPVGPPGEEAWRC